MKGMQHRKRRNQATKCVCSSLLVACHFRGRKFDKAFKPRQSFVAGKLWKLDILVSMNIFLLRRYDLSGSVADLSGQISRRCPPEVRKALRRCGVLRESAPTTVPWITENVRQYRRGEKLLLFEAAKAWSDEILFLIFSYLHFLIET